MNHMLFLIKQIILYKRVTELLQETISSVKSDSLTILGKTCVQLIDGDLDTRRKQRKHFNCNNTIKYYGHITHN